MDAIEEWTAAQQRVIELVGGLSRDEAETTVPATPDWTVRQLLSHMIGLDADVLAGDEPDDHNATWTQKQVDQRAEADVAALVAEWRSLTTAMRDWMARNTVRPMGDVVIHEQDLRGALDRPGARDTPALASLRDRFADAIADKCTAADLEPIRLQGDTCAYGPDNADVVVRTTDFDLARLVLARRSPAQVRGWTLRGDVEPYLPLLGGLGPLRDTDLVE